jgi:ribosomal protein S18 acetylase RimI-like enzyme
MTQSKNVIRLTASQKSPAARALARAFMEDPAYTLILPDSGKREQVLQRLFGAVIGYSLVYGLVHTTLALEGAACWLSPGNTEVTLWRVLRTGLGLQRAVASFSPQARRGFMAALAYMDEIHQREVPGPHWYLWGLGVEPARQGQGIGSRLIAPVLAQADRQGLPCYLETETENNMAFYEKQGFHVVSDGLVPGQSLRIWTLLREPRS